MVSFDNNPFYLYIITCIYIIWEFVQRWWTSNRSEHELKKESKYNESEIGISTFGRIKMIETMLYNFNLHKLVWILKKSLIFIILFALLGTGAASRYAYQNQRELYYANISFYVYSNPEYANASNVNLSWNDLNIANALVNSYLIVLKSNTVLEKIIEKLNLNYSASQLSGMISSGSAEDTAVFYVYVQNENPQLAMDIANAIGEIAPGEISRIVKAGGVEVIDEAKLPTTSQTTMNVLKYAIFGGMAGFFLSLFISILIGLFDLVIRKKKDIEDKFDIPVLGTVPDISILKKGSHESNVLTNNSPFALKEIYTFISTNLLFTAKGEACPVYGVTSAKAGEGKTINCINMAKSMAKLGKKVLVIDADMRKPCSNNYKFETSTKTQGLSHYLAGICEMPNFFESKIDTLSYIESGDVPPNPAELLASVRMEVLIKEMQGLYDCIFIDFPPLGICSDALQPVEFINGYIFVVRSEYSRLNEVIGTIKELEKINANICGFVYNSEKTKYKKYNYTYDYYAKNNLKKRKKNTGSFALEEILE